MSNTRARLSLRRDDFYATPAEAVAALLKIEPELPKTIWEPACGDGAIVLPLRHAGHKVYATDLVWRGCPDSEPGIDFLFWIHKPPPVAAIVTNPPFKLIDHFVHRALKLAPYIAMLTRLNFLAGSSRKRDLFDKHPPARIHVSSKRLPMMHREGWDGPKNGSMMDYCWVVWDARHVGPPTLHWFDWRA